MAKKNKEDKFHIFTLFKYVFIGFITVLKGFIDFIKYMCLGSYYSIFFIIFKPISLIVNGIQSLYYNLFTSGKVKKDKALAIEVNYDEKGENITSSEKKDIYSQMKENRKKVVKQKKVTKLNPKQKERLDAERDSLLKMINDGGEKRFTKPQTFRYKALNPDGKMETSTFLGVSKLDIYTFLTGEGYTVFSIETSDWINFIYGESFAVYKKLSIKDLIFFTTQLSTYIKSGITLTEAMRILSKQLSKNKNIHRIMQSIVYYLTMGDSFSAALEHQAGAFPQLAINMVKAAETAGNLDETLDELGRYYTEINATRKQMLSAISYPAFVGVFSVIIIVIIMLKIVPQFVGIYESAGAELNPLTLAVLAVSSFLQKYTLVLLLVIGIFVFIFIMAYKQLQSFRIFVQTACMKLPVIGKIIIYNELTIFTKTFASLLKNDVFITDSIDILSKLTTNEIYKDIMLNTIANIAKGEKISESFKNHWAIPDIAYYMIVTGENTGELATMMAKVSDYYQEQHSAMVNSLKSLIEPLMIVFLALVVGGILIAVILPMFYLYSSISL